MTPRSFGRRRLGRWLVVFTAIAALFIVACGGAESPTTAPPTSATEPAAPAAAEPVAPAASTDSGTTTDTGSQTAPTSSSQPATGAGSGGGSSAPAMQPTNTPVPTVQPTPRPVEAVVESARDDVVIVINEEPSIPDPWISTTLYPNQIIHNIAQPISFFGPDFTDTATAGFTGFEQVEPNKWRLNLREGVTFHNGEPWNAEAAAYTINQLGGNVEYQPYSQVREAHAEIIDDMTVDFNCTSAAALPGAAPLRTVPHLHRPGLPPERFPGRPGRFRPGNRLGSLRLGRNMSAASPSP